jgi:hypothetical protein
MASVQKKHEIARSTSTQIRMNKEYVHDSTLMTFKRIWMKSQFLEQQGSLTDETS